MRWIASHPKHPWLLVLVALCLSGLAGRAAAYSGEIKQTTRYQRSDQRYQSPAPVVIHATQSSPAPVVAFTLSANKLYAAYLNKSGQVLFTGINDRGQFGDGTVNAGNNNQWEAGPQNVQAIAVGEQTTLLLTSSGAPSGAGYVLRAGANDDGTIGDGNQTDALNFTYGVTDPASPLAGGKLNGVVQIATGREHALALDSNNRIWVTGDNDHGQLGFDPGAQPQATCSSTVGDVTYLICMDTWRVSMNGLPSGGQIISIGAGGDFSLALVYNPFTKKNELYGTGWNAAGVLGQGNTTDCHQWCLIWPDVMMPTNGPTYAAGWWHLIFLDANGVLHGTGDNSCGQLGFGPGDPNACNADQPDNNPSNPNAMGTIQYVMSPVVLPFGNGASPGQGSTVAAGAYTSFAITSNGDLNATGANMTGQLGLGNYNNYQAGFVSVLTNVTGVTGGRYFSLAIRNGDVYYTGSIGNNTIYAVGATSSPSPPDATVPVAGHPASDTWQLSN